MVRERVTAVKTTMYNWELGMSSVGEHLPSMPEVLGSIPVPRKQAINKKNLQWQGKMSYFKWQEGSLFMTFWIINSVMVYTYHFICQNTI
jgi:hypothetical protein